MLKSLFVCFIVSISVFNCDGRNHILNTNKVVLNQHDLLFSSIEQLKCTPREYVEIVTDTIFDNNFKVKLKYFSSEKDSNIKTYKSHNTRIKHYYNNFEAILTVTKNNTVIVDGLINKTLFSQFETKWFWKNAIMQFIWIDYSKTTTNTISLNVSFCETGKKNCKDYTLTIHENGAIDIAPINLSKSTL